jgi:hypothetical protein
VNHSKARVLSVILAAVVIAVASPAARAQQESQDFRQTVARVAFVQGDGSLERGDDPGNWQPLAVNVPLTIGDRVWAGEAGRVELQAPGFRAFLAPGTELTALNLTEDVQQYSVAQGTASFRVISMDDEDEFEIDTPNAAVTLERPGLYRAYVDAAGNTRFAVRLGEARVAAAGGEVSLRAGEEMIVTGIDNPEYDVVAIPLADSWDRWVTTRELRRHEIASYDYTSADVLGAEDLDAYGTWESVPSYGRVWRPRSVAAGWAPYREGHWIWQDPWGWTWVSAEAWGWAPYHYGRWVVVSSQWCWVPVAPSVRHVPYSPALVAFVGGGPGWSASVTAGAGGYVGWFPLAPRDPFVPWWGRQTASPPSSRNVVYANRASATVVARSAFAGARPAQTAIVKDAAIVRQIQSAAVVRGPLPVLPTRESLRPAGAAASHPSAAVLARPVAARLAPPPAPLAFTRKVEVIRESHGAPLTPQASAALVIKSPEGARAAVAIRPVARPDRRVELAVHKDAVGAPPPDPIHASGRTLATANAPLIAHPSGGREVAAPVRVAPGAVVTAVPPIREEKKREIAVAPQTHAVPPQAIAVRPAPPVPAAVPEMKVQGQQFSRPARRVVEPGPDPLAHEAPPARVEVKQEAKPQQKQEVKSGKKNERKPEKGNEKEKPGKD